MNTPRRTSSIFFSKAETMTKAEAAELVLARPKMMDCLSCNGSGYYTTYGVLVYAMFSGTENAVLDLNARTSCSSCYGSCLEYHPDYLEACMVTGHKPVNKTRGISSRVDLTLPVLGVMNVVSREPHIDPSIYGRFLKVYGVHGLLLYAKTW